MDAAARRAGAVFAEISAARARPRAALCTQTALSCANSSSPRDAQASPLPTPQTPLAAEEPREGGAGDGGGHWPEQAQ